MKNESMNKPSKGASRMPQSFIKAAEDFEKSKIEEIKTSRKIAWGVAGGLAVITVLSIVALLISLFNHKDPEPLVLKQDVTGNVSMLRSIKDTQDKYDDVTDKYWLATYMRSRVGYDWYTLSTQFEAVKLMSAPDVATEYANETQAKTAPLNMLKDKAKIVVKINSISFVGDLAQIRYTTERQSTSGENNDGSPVQPWIATISYKYESGLMTEQQRLINPFGFKVLSYHTDAEVLHTDAGVSK